MAFLQPPPKPRLAVFCPPLLKDRNLIKRFPQLVAFLTTLIFSSLAGVVPFAQALQQEKAPVSCTLVSSVTGTGGQDSLLAGLKVDLDPGWKLYAPPSDQPLQEGALPQHPVFDWEKQVNIHHIHLHWPPGKNLDPDQASGLADNDTLKNLKIYDRSFLLPMTLDLEHPHQGLNLRGKVSLIACATQCIPVTLDLSLEIPAGPASPTLEADALTQARLGGDQKAVASSPASLSTLLWMLFVGFLGGALLNFMPCVLPVLSLKLRSFLAQHSFPSQAASLPQKAGASLLGILVSFWGLGAAAILIERSGELFGWGFHFQSPAFLGFMTIVLLFLARSLWKGGTFDLPLFLKNRLQRVLGSQAKNRQDLAENFLTGMFATLLATPCTAPLLGTALAYALSRGPGEILLLFTLMGLGFGFPYLILLFVPASRVWLPKPGPWMETLSKGFALLLLATFIWIAGLLLKLVAPTDAVTFFVLLLISVSLITLPPAQSSLKKAGFICFLGLLILTSTLSPPPLHDTDLGEGWEPFDESKIASYLAEGKTVFVDVTASWCLTCQVNKKLVLDRPPVKDLLSQTNMIKMRADWTQSNPVIASYLKSFQRHGIPFNVVYSQKAPQGNVLPELLTSEAVLKALQK